MNIDEKLALYLDILHCSHPIHLWEYTEDLELIQSDYSKIQFGGDLLSEMKIKDLLRDNTHAGTHKPLFVENRLGLIFLIAYAYKQIPGRVYVLGPAFTGADSLTSFNELLQTTGLPFTDQRYTLDEIKATPIISSANLLQYAVTLHYLINNEHISVNEIEFRSTSERDPKETLDRITSEHRGIYEGEQSFLKLIKEGNPDYAKGLQKMLRLSSGMRVEKGNTVRNAKNNLLVLLTLVSRASIEGGLDPAISYNLNDYYANRLEKCQSVAEAARLSQEMLEDYTQRNRIQRKKDGISRPIKAACDYISIHIDEPITISDLARNAGYTDYYFSRRFKEETGLSVSEYIRNAKIERAKLLLLDSGLSINEIYEELGFGTRNNFFQTFKKVTGVSPSEFRKGIKKKE